MNITERNMAHVINGEIQRCRKWIEDALQYTNGTHEFVDVVNAILEGRMQFWPAENACLVTEIVEYPRKKVLNVFIGGGTLKQMRDMYDALTDWAKAQGCDSITCTGRKGWERIGREYGWTPVSVTLAKELD